MIAADEQESQNNNSSSIVNVYFKDLTCLKYRRDPFMTWDGLFCEYIF